MKYTLSYMLKTIRITLSLLVIILVYSLSKILVVLFNSVDLNHVQFVFSRFFNLIKSF